MVSVAALVAALAAVLVLSRLCRENARLHDTVRALETKLAEHTLKVVETSRDAESKLAAELGQTLTIVHSLQASLQASRQTQERIDQQTRSLFQVILGSASKGKAGEEMLREQLSKFPPDMIQRDFKVGNAPVEFALLMRNGKRVAIDCKFGAARELEALEAATDPQEVEELRRAIVRVFEKRVVEARKYIDETTTLPFAVAAVPDAAYPVVAKISHAAYHNDRVIIVPVSLAVPYLLSLYSLYGRYGDAIDIAAMQSFLDGLEAHCRGIEKEVEATEQGRKIVENASYEVRRKLGEIRKAITSLRELEEKTISSEF